MVDPPSVARVMGGPEVLGRTVRSVADLERLVAEGLPVRALDETVRRVATSAKDARALKDRLVPRATRARRTRLKLPEGERVERLARLVALAEHVWESESDARAFMVEAHPMLDERSPVELAATELGARRVEALLAGLEYGLPV